MVRGSVSSSGEMIVTKKAVNSFSDAECTGTDDVMLKRILDASVRVWKTLTCSECAGPGVELEEEARELEELGDEESGADVEREEPPWFPLIEFGAASIAPVEEDNMAPARSRLPPEGVRRWPDLGEMAPSGAPIAAEKLPAMGSTFSTLRPRTSRPRGGVACKLGPDRFKLELFELPSSSDSLMEAGLGCVALLDKEEPLWRAGLGTEPCCPPRGDRTGEAVLRRRITNVQQRRTSEKTTVLAVLV